MSIQVISRPINSTFAPLVLKEADRTLAQQGRLHQVKDIHSMESEILSKLDNIAEFLKDLEGNFSKVRQELIRKNTIEGRENDKICAVNGKIISNKKKYYKNLEEDVDSLSKAFQDQFKKITMEFSHLQALSKGKPGNYYGSSGENFTYSAESTTDVETACNRAVNNVERRYAGLPTVVRVSKFNEVRTSPSNKDSLVNTFKLRASPEQEGLEPKKVSFGKGSDANGRNVGQPLMLPEANMFRSQQCNKAESEVNACSMTQSLVNVHKKKALAAYLQSKINRVQSNCEGNEVLHDVSLSNSSQEESMTDALSFHSLVNESSSGRTAGHITCGNHSRLHF